MEKLIVHGGNPLNGTVRVSGAKNAVLPIIVASMLGVGKSTLTEIPELADVHTVSEVIKSLGVAVESPERGHSFWTVRILRLPWLRTIWYVVCVRLSSLWVPCLHGNVMLKFLPGGCSIGPDPLICT